ncbi:MAG: hypothetical protein H0V17_10365, partial [Deltaproteobacteria bacterium]|nr:hypothetical protein [Deltaproteobacteria bacterium]
MRLALLVVVFGSACNPFKEGTVTGKIEATGEAGTWVLTQGTCFSGQREQYHGMMAYGPDGSGIGIKLVKDAVRGWSAIVNQADSCKTEVEKGGCRAIILASNNCTLLDVDHKTTNTT